MSSVNIRLRTSSPTASPLRIVHCHPHLLSHPSPLRSWIYLSASRSRIIHRRSCAEPQTSSSFPRAPTTLELSGWASSARLPFAFAWRPLLGAGYTSRSHPTLSLRLRRGALAIERAQGALLLMREWGQQRDVFMPMKQLRSSLEDDADADLMKMEKRANGDGNEMEMEWARVDGDGVQAVTYCPPALLPPSFGFALALPALALLPRPHPRVPLAPAVWYGTRRLQAPAGPASTSFTVVFGIPVLVRRRSMHTRHAGDVDIEAGVGAGVCTYGGRTMHASSHSRSSSRDRGWATMCTRADVAVFFLRRYRGRTLCGFGYNLGADTRSYTVEVGMGKARGFPSSIRTCTAIALNERSG
ncbi:hypothetical protein B0H13DRAFT_2355126 [Mycena leptocephala]|nr:hypothetical protein B0H13DRAFT_2355126 [Mycena leptocephala]